MMRGFSLLGFKRPTYSPLYECRSEPQMHAMVILTSIASSSTSGSAYSRGSSGVSIAVHTIALPVGFAIVVPFVAYESIDGPSNTAGRVEDMRWRLPKRIARGRLNESVAKAAPRSGR